MRAWALWLTLAVVPAARGQFDLEESHTDASLRGIDAVGLGVAWASGAHGTVLRTEDGGYLWQTCTVPPGAEKLDFRGVQAYDANTAWVMSSGPGDESRVYKTTDGCQSWTLVLTNPDGPKDGFFDALLFVDKDHGLVFGDPVEGHDGRNPAENGYHAFRFRLTGDGGKVWGPVSDPEPDHPGRNLMPLAGESAFAASNSAVASVDGWLWFATSGARVLRRRLYLGPMPGPYAFVSGACSGAIDPASGGCGMPWTDWSSAQVPMVSGSAAGIFSIHFRDARIGVSVGGDYTKPNESAGTAAITRDGGLSWSRPATLPHGYRSAVTYDSRTKTWIAVGPNGTDTSTNDGLDWKPLPGVTATGWNAVSLPFAVGANGQIGKLRGNAFAALPQRLP